MIPVETRKNRFDTAVAGSDRFSSRLGNTKVATMLAWARNTSQPGQTNSRPMATMARLNPA